jgi:hypothetical protein
MIARFPLVVVKGNSGLGRLSWKPTLGIQSENHDFQRTDPAMRDA